MSFSNEIESFIKDFAKDLEAGNAAIFAGAGMSKSSGYVDWPELLRDIASELGLDVDKEHDLISLAQFHVNHLKGSAKLAKKIIEEFSEQAEPSITHEILASLPIGTYWTTNYDSLIEHSLTQAYKIPDVKFSIDQLNNTRPKRDAVVYKMHGDVIQPKHAVLYKEQYEQYYRTHEPFITALMGDLVSKTFLFIGFSFSDPNLDYILSRLHTSTKKNHYCFMRKEIIEESGDEELNKYKKRKQDLKIDDLKRYGIQTILIDDYKQIPEILTAIQTRFLKRTIFISGSAESYGEWDRQVALNLIHDLSSKLIKSNLRVVNGFGWGVGSAVINGALDAIYSNPSKFSEDQLIIRPFPQFETKEQNLQQLWEEYRQRMISLSGISIFIFGNKLDKEGKIVIANGVVREFEISIEHGNIPIPIGITGFSASEIYKAIRDNPEKYYPGNKWILPLIDELNDLKTEKSEIVGKVINIIQQLGK